jgi:hypothetical protein
LSKIYHYGGQISLLKEKLGKQTINRLNDNSFDLFGSGWEREIVDGVVWNEMEPAYTHKGSGIVTRVMLHMSLFWGEKTYLSVKNTSHSSLLQPVRVRFLALSLRARDGINYKGNK